MKAGSIQLTPRQHALVSRATLRKNIAVFWPVGTGKSIAALSVAKRWSGNILILARANNLLTWQDEGAKLGVSIAPLYPRTKTAPKGHVVISHDLAARRWKKLPLKNYNTLIVDESYQVKNLHAQRSKAVFEIARRIPRHIILNALPFADQGYVDVFGQFRVLDQGSTYGTSLVRFREFYQYPHPEGWGWIDNPSMLGILTRKASQSADFMALEECDLPERVDKTFFIEWDKTQKEIYETLKEKWFAKHEGHALEVNYTIAKLIKLQQIVGGIFRTADAHIRIPTGKLSALLELVAQIPKRIVVWCAYNPEVDMVCRTLQAAGIDAAAYKGGDAVAVLDEGWKVLVAQLRCGVGINNLTNVQYAIYYSKVWNYYFDYQSRGRTARLSSQHKQAFYFSLVLRGSVDELVEKLLTKKETSAKLFASLGRKFMEQK